MRYRHFVAALVLVTPSVGRAVEPSDLKPGLVATYSDSIDGAARTVTRLEPTVAYTLAKGEAPHPALAKGALTTWKGYINITRAGKYTFSATTAGELTVKVGGRAALGGELQLDGGVIPFEAVFVSADAANGTRVELFWQGPGFVKEPLNHQ